jgi:hypothetical protein
MKPLYIGLLIAAGAVGGAVLMRMVDRPHPEPLPNVVAQAPAPIPAEAPAPATVPAPEPAETPSAPPVVKERPSPFVPPRQPRRTEEASERKGTWPTQSESPSRVEQVLVAPTPAPEPIAPAPVTQPAPVPPARPEPEHETPAPAPPEPHKVTLNAGTLFPVRLVDGLTTERNVPGDLFTATLDKELVVDGFVVAERGARVEGRVVESDRGGRVRGVASLGVELTRLRLSDGQSIALSTDSFVRTAEPTHGQDAAKVGAGAALGAVIGAIAGGGKGAAIGAGAGGAAGAGTVLATRGRAAALPSETRVSFRLRNSVEIVERR